PPGPPDMWQFPAFDPVIRDGWYVVCDPDTNAVAGEFVLVCINNERCIIKEYITERDGLLHLLSVNSGDRLTLELSEVTAIVPIIEILPPSRRVIEVPIFDV
ncbi:MAG: S24 family peptidase, partial [Flavobacteriales bacterium]